MLTKETLLESLAFFKTQFSKGVADFVICNPTKTYKEIGVLLGIPTAEVLRHCKTHGISRPRGSGSPASNAKKNGGR